MKRKEGRREPMLNLKLMRIRRGHTLQSLASAAGVNYNTINAYENGLHAPRLENLETIAKVLECEVSELL